MKRETGTERSEPEAARPEIGRRRDQIDWSAATAA
jgi:hypothetical protein